MPIDKNLDHEWADVLRRMPDYLADREREEREKFVGIASDGLKWVVFERSGNELITVKETILDPDKAEMFLAWLDGAVALKSALPPDPLTVRIELGGIRLPFDGQTKDSRRFGRNLKTIQPSS